MLDSWLGYQLSNQKIGISTNLQGISTPSALMLDVHLTALAVFFFEISFSSSRWKILKESTSSRMGKASKKLVIYRNNMGVWGWSSTLYVGVYIPIVRIPYKRWDDPPIFRSWSTLAFKWKKNERTSDYELQDGFQQEYESLMKVDSCLKKVVFFQTCWYLFKKINSAITFHQPIYSQRFMDWDKLRKIHEELRCSIAAAIDRNKKRDPGMYRTCALP